MQISATRAEAELNNSNLMKVDIGDTKEEFLRIMGPSAKREAYGLPNDRVIEFLFYRTSGWSTDVATDTDSQFTPVAIEAGTGSGWGRNYYDQVVRAALDVTIN